MSESTAAIILSLLQVVTLAIITVLQRQTKQEVTSKLAPFTGPAFSQTVKSTVEETQSPVLSAFDRLLEQLDTSNKTIEALTKGFEAARVAYLGSDQFLKDTLTKLQSDFSTLKEQAECDREQIATLKAEVASLKEQVIKIEVREKRMEQERDNAMIELAKVQAVLEDTKQLLVAANCKIEALTAQHEADLIKIGQQQARIDVLQKPVPDPLATPPPPAPKDEA